MATAPKVTTSKKVPAKVAKVTKTHPPGWQTTEFWVTQLTITAVVLSALDGVLPAKYAAIAVAISQGAFAIARGIAKAKREEKIVDSSEIETETEGEGESESESETESESESEGEVEIESELKRATT